MIMEHHDYNTLSQALLAVQQAAQDVNLSIKKRENEKMAKYIQSSISVCKKIHLI